LPGLDAALKHHGMSRSEHALRVSMTPGEVLDYEIGAKRPTKEIVDRLADALGVSLYDLMEEEALKAPAPLQLEEVTEAEPQSLTDIPQDKFLRALSDAVSDAALLELFGRMDAERTHLELAFRDYEENSKARNTFARAVQRRMMVFLTLIERGIAPPDPEKTRLAEQLENVLRSSR